MKAFTPRVVEALEPRIRTLSRELLDRTIERGAMDLVADYAAPLPMMVLGLVTGGLQAFIFVLLSTIYLQAAVAVEHHVDEHGHDAPHGREAPAAA